MQIFAKQTPMLFHITVRLSLPKSSGVNGMHGLQGPDGSHGPVPVRRVEVRAHRASPRT
jgi:hypothetical protein